MSEITAIVIEAKWDLSGNLPEGLVAWFNVLGREKRVKVIEELNKMV